MPGKKGEALLTLGMAGTILTCAACFTPAGVVLLGLLGLARWAGYLDYVLFPLLGLFLILITIEVIVLWYMPSNVFRALFAGAMFGPTFEAFEGAVDHVMNS